MKSFVKGFFSVSFFVCLALAGSGCSEQPVAPEDPAAPSAAVAPAPSEASISASTSADEIRLEVRLTATDVNRRASGTAKYEQRPDRRRFGTEVEGVAVNGTGRVNVNRAGTNMLNRPIQIVNGFGDLNLDTQNGQTVPQLKAGDNVRVYNAKGQLILRGKLARIQ